MKGTERVEDGAVVQTGVRMERWITKMLDNLILVLAEDSSQNISVESGVVTSRVRSVLGPLD